MSFFRFLMCFLAAFLLSCGSANVFDSVAKKDSDEALLEDAYKANNSRDYDTAIAKVLAMGAAKQAEPETKRLLASAYAGQCGFNFGDFFSSLTSGSSGSLPFLQYMMNQWTTKPTVRASCRLAEETMKSLSPTFIGRAADDSLFMVFLGLAKIGIFAREIADTNPADGTADNPPFDGTSLAADLVTPTSFCSVDNISDEDVAEIGAGISIVFSNLANVGTSLGNLDLSAISGTVCVGTPNPCSFENEADWIADPTKMKIVRSLLNMNAIGLVNGTPCL